MKRILYNPVPEQLPDGRTRELRSLSWSVMVKRPLTPPPPKKKMKKQVCLKMHFRQFPVFWAYAFLSGKSADPTPPLLVKNSTIAFLKSSLIIPIKALYSMTFLLRFQLCLKPTNFGEISKHLPPPDKNPGYATDLTAEEADEFTYNFPQTFRHTLGV